jgi:SWIM zinc finger
LKNGTTWIPVWPNPPATRSSDLPQFCPKEYRSSIVEKFRTHLHQHPAIPFNDKDGTYLTAAEIHQGAVKDMYTLCFQHDLSQAWAYLWNRWYTPEQWMLWACSGDEAIPHIKTTMIVESLWKNIKHRDLAMYNRPRLDLVTHLVITNVLPRVMRTLEYVQGQRRVGRAKPLAGWQSDLRADWLDMSHVDEHRLIEKELRWLKAPAKTKGRTERLAEIAEEERRPHGTYHTSLEQWTCSCPSYLISRFLICKHLVRLANTQLDDAPCTSLSFFAELRRNHYPPFYSIQGIHYKEDTPTKELGNIEIRVLGLDDIKDSGHSEAPGNETGSENATEEATSTVLVHTSLGNKGGEENEREEDGKGEEEGNEGDVEEGSDEGDVEGALLTFDDNFEDNNRVSASFM